MSSQMKMRDSFTGKWGFILACIGSAVGMGNIWRFPIMISKFGGLTFLIPYVLFVFLIGSTGVIEEFALGRAAGSGPIGAFSYCTESRWGNKRLGQIIGFLPVVGSLALAIGYTVVVGWIFKYTYMGISGSLYAMGTDMNVIGGTFGAAAPETQNIAESVSVVLGGAGNNLWLIIGLIASLSIMALGIAGGIEKANKIMMPALFFLFVALGIYIATLPGASAGYRYIFTLDPAGLRNPKLWIFAFGQAFFSLSVAGNGSVIYGSYLSKEENVVSAARNVAVFDTLAALLAAFVIIPSMAAGGAELTKGGPGLMFVYLVNVFNGMPGGRMVGMVFFICVLFAGVSSIVNLYEAPIATLQDNLHLGRIPAVAIIGVLGGIVAIFIQGYTSQWMDIVSIYICPLGAMLAGIMFFYVVRRDKIHEAIQMGDPKPVPGWLIPLGRYAYVPLALAALIAGAYFGGIG